MSGFDGLSELEIQKLITKKGKKWCAMALSDIEEIVNDAELFSMIRKIVLDSMNSYARGVLDIIGIKIEGIAE